MLIHKIYTLLNESRHTFSIKMQRLANEIMKKLNGMAMTKLTHNSDMKECVKDYITSKKELTRPFALFTLCKTYTGAYGDALELADFDKKTAENESIILAISGPKNRHGNVIPIRLVAKTWDNEIDAETGTYAENDGKKIIFIYIPVSFANSNISNAVFQEYLREVLIHELTHVFDTEKRTNHYLKSDFPLSFEEAYEADYFLRSDEIRAYATQAARYARKNKTDFPTALEKLLRNYMKDKFSKEVIDEIIEIYFEKLKTDPSLRKSFGNLMKGRKHQ